MAQLDIPLLNRFEKQHLSTKDYLTPAQEQLLAELQEWTQMVAEDCGRSLDLIFPGFDDNTLGSLVLRVSEFKVSETPWPELKRSALRRLSCCATPLAFIQNEQLSCAAYDADLTTYFKNQGDLRAVLSEFLPRLPRRIVGGQSQSDAPEALGSEAIVITYSPVVHLPLALADRDLHSSTISLAELSSAGDLEQEVNRFLSVSERTDENTAPASEVTVPDLASSHYLFVQVDPFRSSPQVIEHALFILENAMDQAARQVGLNWISMPDGVSELAIQADVASAPISRRRRRMSTRRDPSSW